MLNWKKPNTSQYCSWIAELELYDFEIEHRKGQHHLNADAMSRYPLCEQCELKHEEPRGKRNVKKLQDSCMISEHDSQDPVSIFIKLLKRKIPMSELGRISLPASKESVQLWKQKKNLRLVDDDTLGICIGDANLVIPRVDSRKKLIPKIH